MNGTKIRDLFFADDCALNAATEQEMQREVDQFSSACVDFGLIINAQKTEVMFQPALEKPYHKPHILVKEQRLQTVDNFTYLGSTLSRRINIDDEIKNRIAKASSAFGRLKKKVWEKRGISQSARVKVYKAVVLTTLLYGCEAWTVYRRHEKQLQKFHTRCLRRILNIRWNDFVSDNEVLERANLSSIITMMRKTQIRWAGHVSRMADSRIPKQLFYGQLKNGQRKIGGPRKRYKDYFKSNLKDFNIDVTAWEKAASNWPAWRRLISNGALFSEENRLNAAKLKRIRRKARKGAPERLPTHWCQTCGRGFLARIGLISHTRTYR